VVGKGGKSAEQMELERDILVADTLRKILSMVSVGRRKAASSSEELFAYRDSLDKSTFLEFLQQRPEQAVVSATAHLSADLRALLNYLHAEAEMDYQMTRPSPRLRTTKQRYLRLKNAYRALVAFNFHGWDDTTRQMFTKILSEVGVVKSSGIRAEELTTALRSLAKSVAKDEDDSDD